jgi:hypothetical protein
LQLYGSKKQESSHHSPVVEKIEIKNKPEPTPKIENSPENLEESILKPEPVQVPAP